MQVRWDFLPFFISMRGDLQDQLQRDLTEHYVGRSMDWGLLEEIHGFICDWFQRQFPMYGGLGEWLRGLENVEEKQGS
jgi:hypothetical protein